MALNPQELLYTVCGEYLLRESNLDEQIAFIIDQIKHPFIGGSTNYYRKLRKSLDNDTLDRVCIRLMDELEKQYDSLEFDSDALSERHLDDTFNAVYKFFIKNIEKLIIIFLKEYLHSAKNRKALTNDYMVLKTPNYPKEQYGKKEYYILMTKLPTIIKDIIDEDISLDTFIAYVRRAGNTPLYVDKISDMISDGIIGEKNIVSELLHLMIKSDRYDSIICKLQVDITETIINPYLEETGILEHRLDLQIDQIDLDEDISDEEEDPDSDNEEE